MSTNNRLIDVQKDLIIRFINTYENLKKEKQDRRTEQKLQQYEQERVQLSNKINANNEELVDAGAPMEYLKDLDDFKKVDEKFKDKLKTFFLAIGINYPSDESQANKNLLAEANSLEDQLKIANDRVAELEQLLQQKGNSSENQNVRATQENSSDKITEILNMLVKSQIQQQTNLVNQPRQRFGDTMLEVPVFSGDIAEYKAFKQIFSQAVSSQNWSKIEKFLKLRSKLQGTPKATISSLYIEDDSYDIAWNILDRNYQNPRQLLEYDLKRIVSPSFRINGNDAKSHNESKNTFVNVAANIKQLKLTAIDLLCQFAIIQMDSTVRGRLEDFLGGNQGLPTEDQIVTFLEKEASIYQNIEMSRNNECQATLVSKGPSNKFKRSIETIRTHVSTNPQNSQKEQKCLICGLEHAVVECAVFLSSNNRDSLLKFHKICVYCTKHKYNRARPCYSKSKLKCEKCDEKHITLMHPVEISSTTATDKKESNSFLTNTDNASCTVLPTAVANIIGKNNLLIPIRCLVDLGSESSYVCSHVVQSLRLQTHKTSIKIKGISGKPQCTTSHYVNLQIKLNDPELDIITTKAYVLPTIADNLPSAKIKLNNSLNDLADPNFNTPALVGALLGSDIAPKIFKTDISSKITEDGWLMQPTHLGWIVCGRGRKDIKRSDISTFVTLHESVLQATRDQELNEKIIKFYEIPEDNSIKNNESTNDYCEKLFLDHHYREDDGRYVVPVPWKPDAAPLGFSFRKAVKLFLTQETRWKNDKDHYLKSNAFMEEYIRMAHMTEITDLNEKYNEDQNSHFLAYISIIRKDAITTKLRNVFHASLPTSNGVALNDTMYEGEKLQTDIFNILTKSRSFKFFFSADIEKMFRQISILPEDRNKMKIVWRSNSSEPLKVFRLNTVTYGTDAAPWQAIRTIHQCADDNAPNKIVAQIIKNGFYVDDLLYGADSITECQGLIDSITMTMNRGKFPLTKWVSNYEEVLENIPLIKHLSHFVADEKALVKILGLLYDREADEIRINIKNQESIDYTKRGFLSIAASLYDPIGFVLPVTMRSRLFVQGLWKEKYGWDDILPQNLIDKFNLWYQDLKMLNKYKISRWINTNAESEIELIGFSDASGAAKAAVIYSRVKRDGKYHINFIAAKGNVNKLNTPQVIKSQQNTIPKNELEAAVILVDLMMKVKESLDSFKISFRIYIDSQVALSWIRGSTSNENKFIRRRVVKIREKINPSNCYYVKSAENPADPASRGLSAEQLLNCTLWINGPSWLSDSELPETTLAIETKTTQNFHTQQVEEDIFCRISNFTTLLRVIVFMRRWKHYKRTSNKSSIKLIQNYEHAPITAVEIILAKEIAIKYYQRLNFKDEYKTLLKNQILHKRHWLSKLSPFINEKGLICVGGRLRNADIPIEQRHPIIIPPGHLTYMIIEYTHKSNLHSGNTITIQKLINDYYIQGMKRHVHHVLNKCVKCLRWKAKIVQPEMSQLPLERIETGGVFEKIGVDLAGPIQIKASALRTNKFVKVWIAVFVCLATKAAHLEIVSSLSTEDFLAALTRMISRRGPVKEIWSDNGTNFQGANRIMQEAWNTIIDKCIDNLAIQEIKWKFIPRHSPTFGGLWEACVKSMKYFIKRMEATSNLTYEQLHTLICRIEALLNSRPLYPNSEEPIEPLALTPFHFITLRCFKKLPVDAINKSPLTKKWLTILQIQNDFWETFKKEYLYSLQKKHKWQKQQPNLTVGEIVLIKEPNVSPADWKMGKITKTYPDPQDVVRKVDVQNAQQKETLRAVNQLVPLNLQNKPATNSIRKSSRLSATQVLITWLALTTATEAFHYTTLSPGVHVHKMTEVYVKAADINLVVDTKLNVTNDLTMIESSIRELKNYCGNITHKMHELQSYCFNISNVADIRAQQAMIDIRTMYGISPKSKRWSWIAAVVKSVPIAVLTGGAIYQGVQISNLEHENEKVKERLRKASMLLLNITEVEHDELDHKLTDILKMQQEDHIKNEISSYVNIISNINDIILERHLHIIQYKPNEELHNQYEHISKQMPNIIIPEVDNIFDISKRQIIASKSETVTIQIKVPAVYRTKADHYGIINIPNENGNIINLQNKRHFFEIVLNHDHTSFTIPSTANKIGKNIYNIDQWQNVSSCLSMILQNNTSANNCSYLHSPIKSNQLIKIEDNVAVILTNENITAICNNKQASFKALAAIIYYQNCVIKVGFEISSDINLHFTLNQTILESMDLHPPEMKMSTFRPKDVQVDKLKEELTEAVGADLTEPSAGTSGIIIIYILVFLSVVGLITITLIILICRKKEELSSYEETPQHWVGPIAEERHRYPEREIFLKLSTIH